MKINVSGSIETGQSFPVYVEEKFDKELGKLFEDAPMADVRLKKQGPMIFTSIVVSGIFKKGFKLNAEAEGADAHSSFDEAFKKLMTQVRKEKDKLVKEKKKGK